ncbi:DUF3540 domain-containing protein [Undibacterium sp. Xuan67W]|uniref:DUF3540 domain-containing protein n=1 Tax=Undibacterium sp. Xuan67W TaxID=3413057 RepID=UPI003BEFD7CE
MMHFAEKTNQLPPPAPSPLTLCEAQVVVVLENHCYLLNDGRVARQAISCLITPDVGDRVLSAVCQDETPYILHILQRLNLEQAQMSAPGIRKLALRQQEISVSATDKIALQALHDVEISAAVGVMHMNARNLFTTVNDSMVQNVRNYIGKADQYLLEVKQLLRLHGQQTLITAEKDVKVDGERISMG